MNDKDKRATLHEFEAIVKSARKSLKHVLERIDGDEARATFTGLKAERQFALRDRGTKIGEAVEKLTKDFEAVFGLGEPTGKKSA